MRSAVAPSDPGWASTRNGTGALEPPSNSILATWNVSVCEGSSSTLIVTGETVTEPEALTLILLSSEDQT